MFGHSATLEDCGAIVRRDGLTVCSPLPSEHRGQACLPAVRQRPRRSRFGGPLALSKVHWVRPELVAEITYLGWTDESLLRHTVFVGLRDDKPAREVRREVPSRPKAASFSSVNRTA